jgi:hypothetical protein
MSLPEAAGAGTAAGVEELMTMRRFVPILLLSAAGTVAGCSKTSTVSNSCVTTSELSCDQVLAGDPDAGVPLGLVGYSCAGVDRPDDFATIVQGVPQGQVCSDQGYLSDGTYGYCCSAPEPDQLTTCAYDPANSDTCPEGYAYTCQGGNRPEVYNPMVTCGNGVRERDLVNYCCHGAPRPVGCTEARGACPGTNLTGLTGWVCPQGMRPRGEDFGANESRSDYYYFVCGVPTPAPNGRDNLYCCLIPKPVPIGATCVYSPDSAPNIPNCTANRFAFACYGLDTPDQDYYPRMKCAEPPVRGLSDTGYTANLFCCDYIPPGQGSGTGSIDEP